ncbi:DUF4190 domain-containing protein [Serinicoccus kebangsaanensis]|uniref:DUF4190 domain-containing protein n=1 Tax=Serinicoccus kebangsaanensis TaxID=2602069 RepID=UPI00124C3412|nr:DUF4190 domain-containing protein [Serinicoccus kebangsaanensis]
MDTFEPSIATTGDLRWDAGHHHPRGTLALVLGVLSIAGVTVIGPVAWVVAHRALAQVDASPHVVTNRGQLVAAQALGMISTGLLALGVVTLLAMLVVVGAVGLT